MPSSLRSLLLLIGLGLLLANCAKWKLNPYDLVPQVKTGAATAPATTSVQVDAVVTELGPNTLQEFGVVYSTTNQLPTVNDTKVKADGTSGTAKVMLNGLLPNTTYYYRTYAINNKGLIGYGDVQSVKTATVIADVRTLDPVGVAGPTSFTAQVQVVNAGTISIKEFGVVYSTSVQIPTTADTKVPAATTSGALQPFPIAIASLQPNTTYYYRAYAITTAGDISYGDAKSIKTGEPEPVAVTGDVVGTASTTAVSVAFQVTNASAITLKESGICYSTTNQNPTTADSKVTAAGSATATTVALSPLLPGTTYYYRAYATNGAGLTKYGDVKTVKTADAGLTVETLDIVANSADMTKATIQFQLANAGNVSLKEYGVCYSPSSQTPTIADTRATATVLGASTLPLTGLQPNTTYYYRAYVTTNAGVTTYGAVKTFKTLINSLVIFGNKDKKLYAVHTLTGVKQWDYITNGATLNASPTFANGNVFVAGFDGYLYAIEAATGVRKWQRLSSGQNLESSPTIVNGVLYIGSDEKWVSAFDITNGDAKWRFPQPGQVIDQVTSSPAVVGNVVYVGCQDGNLYAIDATTGKQVWKYTTGGKILSSPTVVGGVVYIGSTDKKLYAINTNGTLKWTAPLPDNVNSCPQVSGTTVYVGCDDGILYAVGTASGAIVWRSIKTGRYIGGSPTYSNGVVYVGSGDNKIYAFDAATGAKKWEFLTSSETYASPVVASGLVFVGSQDGKMYCLDATTGVKQWEFASGDQIFATPLILLNGAVIGDYPTISGLTN